MVGTHRPFKRAVARLRKQAVTRLRKRAADPFRDEQGFTTAAMALSLLIALALVFTGAQVYRINSASAEVQDVADAAALSAENQVGEFMVVAQFCDATVLSLSLTATVTTGLGIAALCTPATASLSAELLQVGRNLFETRDKFAERAASVLDKLQKALPFFAAASAAGVAAANNADSQGASYIGAAVLVLDEGEPITVDVGDEVKELLDDIDEQADNIRDKAKEAEEAAKEANAAKERAFRRDCGDDPDYCMYERASKLAGMSGAENPRYSSVDTWSFSVALERAKAYYARRLQQEALASQSVEEQAKSACRRIFYDYACREMQGGYVHETADSFDAYFPRLPHNTQQMRQTSLYTTALFPISEGEDGKSVMHAWAGCPSAGGATQIGSIAQMEAGDFAECPDCCFSAASLGKVAAASTSIQNGFEYHYEAVADEAALYREALERAKEPKSQVKDQAGSLLEELAELAKSALGKRIEPEPPGRYGAIAFAVNVGTTPAAGRFASGFVSSDAVLGPRAAVSAATLLFEESDEGRTVINSMLDGLRQNGGFAVGAAGIVLDAWSFLLLAYSDGQQAIGDCVRNALDSLPLVGASGLGSWAADKLRDAVQDFGLQPAEMRARKAVLVNSGHVAQQGGSFGHRYLAVKQRVISAAAGADDLFGMVLNDAESEAMQQIGSLGDRVDIASIELLGEGGPSIPVAIPLPDVVKSYGTSAVQGIFAQLRSIHAQTAEVNIWE